jgi:uncharacterized protein (DUF1684 family)
MQCLQANRCKKAESKKHKNNPAMKSNQVLVLLAVIVVIVSVFYAFQGSQDDEAYKNQIEKERAEKDRFMRASAVSPFANSTDTFKGLNYYPPDIHYRIVADLHPIEQRRPVTLSTNDGEVQNYLEYAYAEFKLDDVRNKLLILEITDSGPSNGKLFLAFGDETSAGDTYGAGRYLDVDKTPGSRTIKLDFNLAYNPYCAYKDTYACPLPPAQNLLKVAIKAGEKNYH